MNRSLVIAAIAAGALLGTTAVGAQTIGLKLGASFANWNIDATNAPATDRLTSFVGGGFVRFDMGRFAIQPELLVDTRGADVTDTGELSVNYIDVPILAVVPLRLGPGIRPYLIAGPDFAYEFACELNESGADLDYVECHHEIEAVPRKRTDIGVIGGAGLEFPVGPGALLLEGRYNWGLLNISDDRDVTIKSRTGALFAGYSITL